MTKPFSHKQRLNKFKDKARAPAKKFNSKSKEHNNGRWSLNKLYPGLKSRKLAKDKAFIEDMVVNFTKNYDSSLEQLSGAKIGEAIEQIENITNKTNLITSYVDLLHAENIKNFDKTKALESWLSTIEQDLSPFIDKLVCMKEETLLYKLVSPQMAKYAPWIASLRADNNNNDVSTKIQSLSQSFENIHADGLTAFYQQQVLAIEDQLNELAIANDTIDLSAARTRILKQHSPRFATLLNTLIKSRDVDRKWSGHKRQDQEFLSRNKLDKQNADMIFDTVKKSYISLSHRYYKWLAKQHGKAVLPASDILEPKPNQSEEIYDIPWNEAQETVLEAFHQFSPAFAAIAAKFFDENYIDAMPRSGKDSGGFSYPTGPEGHPFILINYYDDMDSLVVLAHELGHGIHMVLAEQEQGGLLSETNETLAETASVFAEILLFDYLRGKETDPVEKQQLLEQQISGMLESALLQMAYYDFEKRIYSITKTRDANAEEISDIWVDILQDYYGPSIEIDEEQRYSWCTLSHFFDMPSFYVYSYSFAQVMVNSLYKLYEGADDKSDFVKHYTEVLKSGMSKDLQELLHPFQLDPSSDDFWKNGLALIEDYLNELEAFNPPTPTPSSIIPAPKLPPKRPTR